MAASACRPRHANRARARQVAVILFILSACYVAYAHCSARGADGLGGGAWQLTPSSAWALAAPRAQRTLPAGWERVIGAAANHSTEYLANHSSATYDRVCDAVLQDLRNGTLASVSAAWNRTVG